MNTVVEPLTCMQESCAQVMAEIEPLMRAHWEEVGHYRDIPIDPDFEKYQQFERAGILRLYALRNAGKLSGYAIYLLGTALHYKDVITAQESTVYVTPIDRKEGNSEWFERCVEEELVGEGVQMITRHVKAKFPRAKAFVRMLSMKGYELQDYVLTKRLT